jgi:hypothetical protein
MFSDYQLAEPPGALRQRPAASACAFGKTDAVGGWLRRPGREPGFPFLRVWVPGAAGEWRSRCSGSLVWACSPARSGLFWKSASWTETRGLSRQVA